jgi:hypothetical protein
VARPLAAVVFLVVLPALPACSNVPSKKQALAIVVRDVREEATCTLEAKTLSRLKMQYTTKAACVPKEGAADLKGCVDALVAAGATKGKPPEYMRQWPDEVATASLTDIPAFERRARELVFASCVEMTPDLREGRFPCGKAEAKEVLKVSAEGDDRALVRYERAITLATELDRIERACAGVTKPPVENTVTLERAAEGWRLLTAKAEPPTFLPPSGTKSYH